MRLLTTAKNAIDLGADRCNFFYNQSITYSEEQYPLAEQFYVYNESAVRFDTGLVEEFTAQWATRPDTVPQGVV